jgi:secondary thiamine-phosphate synthase enzyme
MTQSIAVSTKTRYEAVDITKEVEAVVRKSGITEGVCYLYVPHTTAGVFINEHDDPAVAYDIMETLEKMVPRNGKYTHAEGNSDSHIKAVMTGSSVTMPITGGWLGVGRWQGIFFAEFDGPRTRNVQVTILKA